MLVSTGATTWGADWKQYPWTTGWQPAYQFEGKIYGQAIARNSPNAKIGVLYQNDDYGKDYIAGLEAGLGSKTSNIVDKEPFEVTAAERRVADREAEGDAAQRSSSSSRRRRRRSSRTRPRARSSGRPPSIYTNSVSATDTFLTLAKASGAGDLVNKTFTTQYAKDPANPKWDNDAAMKLYKQMMAKYYPKGRVTDALNFYGVAHCRTPSSQLLYAAGKNPTRASLMKAYRNWNQANPFLLPGVKQQTGADEPVPDQVRADDQVHGRHVQARVRDQVRTSAT